MSEGLRLSPKACPLCGNKNIGRHFRQFSKTEWEYECGKCGLSTGKYQSKEEAIAVWNSLPRKPKWTKKKPKKQGYYWYRPINSLAHKPEPASIVYYIQGSDLTDNMRYGEWFGPIPEPDDEK